MSMSGGEGAEQVIAMIAPEIELLQNPASQTHGGIRQSKCKRLRPFCNERVDRHSPLPPTAQTGLCKPSQLRSAGTLAEVFSPIRFAFVKNGLGAINLCLFKQLRPVLGSQHHYFLHERGLLLFVELRRRRGPSRNRRSDCCEKLLLSGRRADAKAVSYTHLDVYKRQALMP